MASENADIVPVKCGIRLTPPAIVLMYKTVDGKLIKRRIPVRNFRRNSSLSLATEDLRQRHKQYLQNVSTRKIEKMLRIIQEYLKLVALKKAVEAANPGFSISNEDIRNWAVMSAKNKTWMKNLIKTALNLRMLDLTRRADLNSLISEKIESEWDDIWN